MEARCRAIQARAGPGRSIRRTGSAGRRGARARSGQRRYEALTAYEKGLNSGKAEDWPPKDEFYVELRKLEAQKESLESALAAIRIRFDQGADAVVTFAAATKNLSELITAYWLAWSGKGAPEGDGGDHAEALSLSTEWDDHRDKFLAAAQATVGVQL